MLPIAAFSMRDGFLMMLFLIRSLEKKRTEREMNDKQVRSSANKATLEHRAAAISAIWHSTIGQLLCERSTQIIGDFDRQALLKKRAV
jgi:hypothetical protein